MRLRAHKVLMNLQNKGMRPYLLLPHQSTNFHMDLMHYAEGVAIHVPISLLTMRGGHRRCQ